MPPQVGGDIRGVRFSSPRLIEKKKGRSVPAEPSEKQVRITFRRLAGEGRALSKPRPGGGTCRLACPRLISHARPGRTDFSTILFHWKQRGTVSVRISLDR